MLTEAGLEVPDYIGLDGQPRPTRHANELYDHYGVAVHLGLQVGGDLVFFSKDGSRPTHVGIVRDEETYIHAPGHDGTQVAIGHICVTNIVTDYLGRKIYATNPIGFKSPTVANEKPTYRWHQSPL